MATQTCSYLAPQSWWYDPKTPIVDVFLMMQSAESMKWKSAGWTRYSKFSKAKTIGEAFRLGATRADIKYQVERGNITLRAPTAAARKKYDADRAKKGDGQQGWLDARKEKIASGAALKTLANSPEDHVSRGSIVDQLGQVHKDAGVRGIKRATPAMPCFTMQNAAGDTIHSTSHEGHEQLVATWCLSPDDCVLEIGGGVGAVSTMIQKIIATKSDHVVVEPQARMCETLEANKKMHSSGFFVARGALAKGDMYTQKKAALDGPDSSTQRQWMFHRTNAEKTKDAVKVRSWDPATLRKKVSKDFTAVVVDCEGAFPGMIEDFPNLLDGVRIVYLERDGPPGTNYRGVDAALEKQRLVLVLAASKHRVYIRATPAELKKRDAARARRLNNRVDAKTASSYRGTSAKPGSRRKAPARGAKPAAAAPASAGKKRRRSYVVEDVDAEDSREPEVVAFKPATSRQRKAEKAKKQRLEGGWLE